MIRQVKFVTTFVIITVSNTFAGFVKQNLQFDNNTSVGFSFAVLLPPTLQTIPVNGYFEHEYEF